MRPYVDEELCTGAAACYEVCPADPNVFAIVEEKAKVIHPEACIECLACENSCPTGAIEVKD